MSLLLLAILAAATLTALAITWVVYYQPQPSPHPQVPVHQEEEPCTREYVPVCTADGQVFGNACEHANAVRAGTVPAGAATFLCP